MPKIDNLRIVFFPFETNTVGEVFLILYYTNIEFYLKHKTINTDKSFIIFRKELYRFFKDFSKITLYDGIRTNIYQRHGVFTVVSALRQKFLCNIGSSVKQMFL